MTNNLQSETMLLDNTYVMHTYARLPVVFVRGEGCYVFDENDKRYLDLVAGIAVNGLGHAPKKVADAICEQANTLIHTSNLYYTPGQPRLAKLLVELSGMDRVFFCNSGAEANEAAIKLARKACIRDGETEKIEIVTALQSFHGRTMATIAATGQPKYQKSFLPLVPGFKYIPYNDCDALADAVGENTCAVMMEPVQGESGVHPATGEFMALARELCDKHGAALVLDEVQTGLGRTGKMFGFEHFNIKPDVLTLAKTLAGGFPMGACIARGKYADVFEPGDHASTFGGNPLACAAAMATVGEIVDSKLAENADAVGGYFRQKLADLPYVSQIRGLGLMAAVEFERPIAKEIAQSALKNGLILNPIGENIIRMVPPLILTEQQVDEAMGCLREVLSTVGDS